MTDHVCLQKLDKMADDPQNESGLENGEIYPTEELNSKTQVIESIYNQVEDDQKNGIKENGEVERVEEEEEIQSTFQDGQLSCIGQDIEEIPPRLIDDYSKVTRRLDLSFNRIKKVHGLEEFLNLEELVLDNNEIDSTTDFPHLAHLHTLTLNKNKLSSIDALLDDIESKFPQLTYLSLLGNTACPNQLSCHDKDEEDYLRYRHYVLYRIPRLKFLDSSPVKSSDLEEAKRVGPFMRMVRGSDDTSKEEVESPPSSPTAYSPLPDSRRTQDQHLGSFGKSKYVYYGKHSEGNRFIRNTDL